jgi:hypothetical protein
MTTDDDRVAYLEGETHPSLDSVERAELDELRALLADEAMWAVPADDLEDRVVAAVADASTAASAPLPPPATSTPVAPITSSPSVRRRSGGAGRRGWMIAVGGIAAALALVLGAGFLATRDDGSTDSFDMALAPTDVVPDASGDATLTKTDSGWRIELDATGLPRLDNGRFYEAWLRNPEGVLVSVGTFNEPADVTLWSGVSPRTFTAFAVTEEEADGNPASSGRRVLTGQFDVDG